MYKFSPALIFALFAVFPARAADECHLVQMASVPMNIDDSGRIEVPMTIAGKPLQLMIDTGNPLTMLSYDTAQTLGLELKHVDLGAPGVPHLMLRNGLTVDQYTKAHDIAFGQLKTDSMQFAIFPGSSSFGGIDGLLGNDIMANYDVDFDFANGKFNLFSQDHCTGQVVYWTRGPVAVIPFSRNILKHIFLNVELDGKSTEAIVDTGTARSVGDWQALKNLFNIDESSPGVKAVGDRHIYPFKTLSFGGVTIQNPDITLVPPSAVGPQRETVLIGINVLRQLHLYIANGEKKLYVTPASAH